MNTKIKKDTILGITLDELRTIYKDEKEVGRVKNLLLEAEQETKEKNIIILRKERPLYKKYVALKNTVYYGIHWSKPFYPLRVGRNVLLSKFYRYFNINRFVFRGCEFALTFKCNFTCSHCLCERLDESGERKELNPEDYARIVKQAMKLGATSYGLEGGEPFINSKWEEIIKACKPKYNHLIISTNGYMFNEERAKKCAELGVDTINFSLDSGISELHDVFRRKKGSFERVMRGVKYARKYGLKIIFNSVVHKNNLYTRGFRELLEIGEKNKIMVNILFAKELGAFKDSGCMLNGEDFSAYEKITAPYAYACIHHDTRVKYNYGNTGCHGTKEMTNFTPYGDVMNCALMHIYLGNIKDEPLAIIRERALKITPFAKYRPCYLTMDKDFMNVFYPLLKNKPYVKIEEFVKALSDYEVKNNKIIYPELHKEAL